MNVKSESEVAQSCPTLSDPIDCSLPGASLMGLSQPLATTNHFTVSIGLPFTESHMVGIVQHVAFPEQYLSLINIHLSLLDVFIA